MGLDTFRALVDLQQREIEPEDYELLTRLHSRANTLRFSAAEIELGLPIHRLRNATSQSCAVCMGELGEGERVRILPCSARHVFHADCIREWLTMASVCCPVDREDLRTALRPKEDFACLVA